jgi:hypothetical protein
MIMANTQKHRDGEPQYIKVCRNCQRTCGEDGRWHAPGRTFIPPDWHIFDGLCLECCGQHYAVQAEIHQLLLRETSVSAADLYVALSDKRGAKAVNNR